MSTRNFDEWVSQFKSSISGYSYYVDFEKVVSNANKLKVQLNIMNSLVGTNNIESEFRVLVKQYPEILKCIPTLIAVRSNEISILDKGMDYVFNFERPNYSIDDYCIFMREIGLFDLISNRLVSNLYDYVLGVETGLDSNGRKNRGGHLMEEIVASFFEKMDLDYHKEMYISSIESKWGLDLSSISNNGDATKRFDFVVEVAGEVYAFEVNFYSSSGSKLNETARSYKMIATEAKNIPKFHFVWITDGFGWRAAQKNLKETFDVLETIYCIKDLENGVLEQLLFGGNSN